MIICWICYLLLNLCFFMVIMVVLIGLFGTCILLLEVSWILFISYSIMMHVRIVCEGVSMIYSGVCVLGIGLRSRLRLVRSLSIWIGIICLIILVIMILKWFICLHLSRCWALLWLFRLVLALFAFEVEVASFVER